MLSKLQAFYKLNKNNNKGSTMVEVLVGFTILVIVLVECMVHIVGVSSEMVAKSVDMQNDQVTLNSEIYQTGVNSLFEDIDGVTITLTIDESKTNMNANQANPNTAIGLNAKLKRYHSEATDITVFKLILDKD
ncbi:MAG: prepilin-type N-terminal cleavage/methylation domain-containing protein [Lachnospiraceae bacterium]|nr:prepilin-type N-terminal cleavage/methylation domain-containing protein [Lachnospiraceae bacterium]